jgi:5'-3' exonuclease
MTDQTPARMLIVDGMSVLKTTAGGTAFLTNGFAYNFFTQLTATLKKFPDVRGVVVVWEGGYDHRSAIYPEYKKTRKPNTQEFREQRKLVQELLELLGVEQVHAEGYEGDDMGAWLVHNLGCPTLLYSNDKDWLQLVGPGVSIYQKSPYSEGKKHSRVEITREKFEHYTGWPSPELYLKAKCIMGDKDEVPGIDGIGDATARSFLLGLDLSPARREKIESFLASPQYAINMKLGDLRTPQPEIVPIWRHGKPSEEASLKWLNDIGWPSLVKVFPAWWEVYTKARL